MKYLIMPDSTKHITNSTSPPRGGKPLTGGKGAPIEIRSGEVQEILGGVPSRIIRYGIFIFVAVFAIIILAAFVFQYPDILRSNIVVTTENPPADIVARSTGKIEELMVADNQKVKAGQIIALIQNPAEYKDIQKLDALIDSIQPVFDSLGFVIHPVFDKNLQLGIVLAFIDDGDYPGILFTVFEKVR